MNRHTNEFLRLITALLLVASGVTNIYQWFIHKQDVNRYRDFCAVNDIPIAFQEKEIKNIKKYAIASGVPVGLIMAIGQSERGLGTHTFGVKKVNLEFQVFYNPDDWQLVQCVYICKKMMYAFCVINNLSFRNDKEMKEYIENHKTPFMYLLAERYCPLNAEEWYSNVLSNWHRYERGDKIEHSK
jgi:hypothetical protein